MSAMRCSRPAETRLTPFSYFCTFWNVRSMPSARPDCDSPRSSLSARILRSISTSSAPARRFLVAWEGSVIRRPLVETADQYLLFRYLVKPLDCSRRVEADRVCDVHEFDDVDAALPGFDERDVGLVALEALGDLHLREVRVVTLFDDELDQRLVARRAEGAGHRIASDRRHSIYTE